MQLLPHLILEGSEMLQPIEESSSSQMRILALSISQFPLDNW